MRTRFGYMAVPLVTLILLLTFPHRISGVVALWAATAIWWVSVFWYAARSKWHKNPYGRNTMGVSVGLAALLSVFVSGVVFGRYSGYEVIWTLVFLNLAVLGVQRIYYTEKAQRHTDVK